jgi:hypothetical protein
MHMAFQARGREQKKRCFVETGDLAACKRVL